MKTKKSSDYPRARTAHLPPNVMIIYPDQMRGDSLGCAGNACIKTPHIDRIAYEGVRFENAFTSFPLCSPFRASFFTGKYAHAAGVYANHYPIPLDQEFLAELFLDGGYQTGYFGKWHLDGGQIPGFVPPGERRLGFESFVGFNRGHHYFNSIYYADTDQPFTSARYEPDYQTDHLLEFLDRCISNPGGRPFFAMVSYGLPHPPLIAPQHYLSQYAPGEVQIKDSVPPDEESQQNAKEFLAKYYGLISCVDFNIGRILSWLDRHEKAHDTVVVLVSDHGELAGEHGLYAKKNYHRASMHVPLFVRYPGRFPANHVVNTLVDPSVDTMPTLLELCELSVPNDVQGRSFLPLLDGSSVPIREAVFYEILMELDGPERFPIPERGVRTLDWLYVRNRGSITDLYDLVADPDEMHNLANDDRCCEVIKKLDRMLVNNMQNTNDNWDIAASFPPPDYTTYEQGHRNVDSLLKTAVIET